MTTRSRGPRTVTGALVTVDALTQQPKAIAFQYNPATLQRTLQPQMVGGEEGDRSQAVRFTGAPVQMINVEIELDASDQLEIDDRTSVQLGIHPQLAALELLVYPRSTDVNQREQLLASGVLEVAPMTAPRTLFIWGARRVLPVRLMNYTITEDAFDAHLNPIRATVSLSMRVLNYSDLTSDNREYHQFMSYQQSMEAIVNLALTAPDQSLGVNSNQL